MNFNDHLLSSMSITVGTGTGTPRISVECADQAPRDNNYKAFGGHSKLRGQNTLYMIKCYS